MWSVFTCRLAQATYRTPSTVATGQDDDSPSTVTFQGFACSPALDQTSPLATFLHHLSHATYEAAPESKGASAAKAAAAETSVEAESAGTAKQGSPEMQPNDPTPYMDFMKFLTQATYHSPGTKPEPEEKGASQRRAQISSGPVREAPSAAAATPCKPFVSALGM